MIRKFIFLTLLLAACDSEDGNNREPYRPASVWSIRDGNSLVNGNTITIRDNANYITKSCDLTGKSTIRLRFTLDGVVYPKSDPLGPPLATLYFQRRGDNWSAKGDYEAYRWYASFATAYITKPGEYQIEAPLNGNWTAILTSSRENNPQGFADALADCERMGFVLGGGTGLGHGVVGPATLTIQEFQTL